MPAAKMTGTKQGWELNCDCGFMLRDYNQAELIQLTQTHVKNTHGQKIDEKAVLGMARPVKS